MECLLANQTSEEPSNQQPTTYENDQLIELFKKFRIIFIMNGNDVRLAHQIMQSPLQIRLLNFIIGFGLSGVVSVTMRLKANSSYTR